MKAPCKGCEYRNVGCHGKCTAYIGDNVMRIRKCNRNKKYGCTVND